MARLGDLTNIKTGKLDANAASPDGQYPFFTCSKETLRIDTYQYDCECVLVAGNGDLNVKYYNGKFDAYQRTYIIESKNKSILSVPYLYRFLDKYVETLRELSIGGVIKYIKLGNLTDAEIPLPTLQDQEKIVAVLDKLSGLISLRKQQLAKLDELVKARFVEMFGDGNYPCQELISLIADGTGLSYGIVVPGENVRHGIPMIRPSDFEGETLMLDKVYMVSPEIESRYAKTRLLGTELLVQVIGQPGRIMLSDTRCKGMNVTRNLAVVRPDEGKVNRIYLKAYMQTQDAQKFMLSETKQSTLRQLPLNRLKALQVPLPGLNLQNHFAIFVKQADKSKLTIQQSLDKLEILKKSLMQKYF